MANYGRPSLAGQMACLLPFFSVAWTLSHSMWIKPSEHSFVLHNDPMRRLLDTCPLVPPVSCGANTPVTQTICQGNNCALQVGTTVTVATPTKVYTSWNLNSADCRIAASGGWNIQVDPTKLTSRPGQFNAVCGMTGVNCVASDGTVCNAASNFCIGMQCIIAEINLKVVLGTAWSGSCLAATPVAAGCKLYIQAHVPSSGIACASGPTSCMMCTNPASQSACNGSPTGTGTCGSSPIYCPGVTGPTDCKAISVTVSSCTETQCRTCAPAANPEATCGPATNNCGGRCIQCMNNMQCCTDGKCRASCNRGTCLSYTCPDGTTKDTSLASPFPCAGATCTSSECCQGSCAGYSCATGTILKTTGLPSMCTGESCSNTECCNPKGTCSGYSTCPAGTALDVNPPTFCAGTTCTSAECCQGACIGFTCSPATLLDTSKTAAGTTFRCVGETCNNVECCLPKGTCSVFPCTSGTAQNQPSAFLCNGLSCTNNECCQGVCAGLCTGTLVDKTSPPAFCTGEGCTTAECCDAKQLCSAYTCSDTTTLTKNPDRSTYMCATKVCTDSECCIPKGQCSTFTCPTTMVKRTTLPLDYKCNGATCLAGECCENKATCSSITTCPAGTRKNQGADFLCGGSTCQPEECCQGNCNEISCDFGTIAKSPLPGFCPTELCANSFCCDTRAFCGNFACPPGAALDMLVGTTGYMCVGATCTSEECCQGTCAGFACSSTTILRMNAPTRCNGEICTNSECCKAKDHCLGLVCSSGTARNKPDDYMCSTAQCTNAECCQGSCDSWTCASGTVTKVNPVAAFPCIGESCTNTECCDDKASCSAAICGSTTVINPDLAEDFLCSGKVCREVECCVNKGQCAAYTCASGFVKKGSDMPTLCAGQTCTNSECCDEQAPCSTISCPAGTARNMPLDHRCEGKACDPSECCQGVCTNFVCDADEVAKTAPAAFCYGETCLHAECCDKRANCKGFSCKPGTGRDYSLPTSFLCENAICTNEECCAGTCVGFDCDAATEVAKLDLMPSLSEFRCIGETCTNAQCCDTRPDCTAFSCADGTAIDLGLVAFLCAAKTCTNDECCEGSCVGWDCTYGTVGNPAAMASTFRCTGERCTNDQCCDDRGKCAASICSATTVLNPLLPTNFLCKLQTCTEFECCVNKGACASYMCSSSTVKKGADMPTLCMGATCQNDECCEAKDTCASFAAVTGSMTCAAGTTKSQPDGYECAGHVCTQAECCQGTCEGFSCSAVTVLKANPPALCAGETCMDSECCDPKGMCSSAFTCAAGTAQDYSMLGSYCAKQTCTNNECCQGTCTGFNCGTDALPKTTLPMDYRCTGETCTKSECCDNKDTCGDLRCSANTARNQQNDYMCAGTQCTNDECCQGTCTAWVCADGSVTKVPAFTDPCRGEQCVNSECCDLRDKCDDYVCPASKVLNPDINLNTFLCASKACTEAECCVPKGVCTTRGCDAHYVLKTTDMPTLCASSSCTNAECCDAKDTCGAFDCGAHKAQDVAATFECAGKQCTSDECCGGTCVGWQCGTNTVIKTPQIACGSESCQNSDCCDNRDTCGVYNCPAGTAQNMPAGYMCVGSSCTSSECCQGSPPQFTCPETAVRNPDAPVFCAGEVCTYDEVCLDRAKCGGFPCPTGTARDSSVANDYMCLGNTCTSAECCQGSCSNYICPSTQVARTPVNTRCAGETCTDAECCVPKGVCTTFSCPATTVLVNPSSKMCASATCTQAECCVSKDKCTAAVCSVSAGYLPKDPLPTSFCSAAMCLPSECCNKAICDSSTTAIAGPLLSQVDDNALPWKRLNTVPAIGNARWGWQGQITTVGASLPARMWVAAGGNKRQSDAGPVIFVWVDSKTVTVTYGPPAVGGSISTAPNDFHFAAVCGALIQSDAWGNLPYIKSLSVVGDKVTSTYKFTNACTSFVWVALHDGKSSGCYASTSTSTTTNGRRLQATEAGRGNTGRSWFLW